MTKPVHDSSENGHTRPGRTQTTTTTADVLAEIIRRIDDVYNKQETQITRVQEEMISWREINERLTQLLHTKALVTQEVSDSYTQLVSYLTRFSTYLAMSEATLTRTEPFLLSLSKALPNLSEDLATDPNSALTRLSPAQTEELLQAIAEVKTANQQMQEGLKQTLRQMQKGMIAPGQSKKETSIWIDLANWKAALFWFGMGSVFVAGMMYVVFRGSGFQQAMRALQLQGGMVDARLERIEIWLGIEGVQDETPNFIEKDMPEE